MPNRLAKETSPYLLQHQNNPVDWYPWGPEALQRAKNENKPILLSIGYSACHWCHVMEHECFENTEIASQMNAGFINIKVDREERPDLDHIYQNVAQAITRGGGWPLTVFLTPELKPFFGGTYFPPEDRYGRPGFPKVLQALTHAYNEERDSVEENALKLTEWIAGSEPVVPRADLPKLEKKLPDATDLKSLAELLLERIDWENGGFGDAPKFPNPMLLSFLWRYGSGRDHERARSAVILTLRKIASGGIYDQLGGGFHRYSVDPKWLVPHFEKMLYDNALLLRLYSEVILSGGEWLSLEDERLFVGVLKGTKDYLFREMKAPNGSFYSAQDADSEGVEGKFFVWTKAELARLLTTEELALFTQFYGVTDEGNFEHGNTILTLALPLAPHSVGSEMNEALGDLTTATEFEKKLSVIRQKVLTHRSKRVPPGLDNKVLASWNGLMISGLAWAARVFQYCEMKTDAEEALAAANQAFVFVELKMTDQSGKLASTFQGNAPKGNAYLDDYAFLSQAALDLARSNTDQQRVRELLSKAELWIDRILQDFGDTTGGIGFYFTSVDHEALIHRPKSLFDQAIPSGTAATLGGMLALSEMGLSVDGTRLRKLAEEQLKGIFQVVVGNPYGFGEMLCSLLLAVEGPIVVSGRGAESLCWHSHIYQKPSSQDQKGFQVCHQQVCQALIADKDDAAERIREIISASILTP